MALPKLTIQEFRTILPIIKKEVLFRQFLSSEQKILLMALETKDGAEILDAVTQVVQNCIITKGIKVEDLSSTDLEHIFIEIRKKSVGEKVSLKLRHQEEGECQHATEVEVDLANIKCIVPPGHTNKILLTDNVGVVMRYPSIRLAKESSSEKAIENTYNLLVNCIEYVFDDEKIYLMKNDTNTDGFTKEEITQWLGNLSADQIQKIINFFDTIPYNQLLIDYQCPKCGKVEKYELKGLQDFFI